MINRSGGVRTNSDPYGNSGHIDMAISGAGMFGFYGNPAGGEHLGMGLPGFWNNTYAQWVRPVPLGRPLDTEGQGGGILSTICQIDVCPKQASAMRRELKKLESNPGKFDIVGWNCSSHACEVLGAGGYFRTEYPASTRRKTFRTHW